MNSKQTDRRGFLKDGVLLAGLAVGGIRTQTPGSEKTEAPPYLGLKKDLRALGGRSRFTNTARLVSPGTGAGTNAALTPLQDSAGIITPSDFHFTVTRFPNVPPDIDPRQHRLLIHGLVERPLIFTMEELKRLPSVSRIHFVECAGNASPRRRDLKTIQETHGLTACSEWTGVPLSLLLRDAALQKGASWVVAESADAAKHWMSIPLEKAMEDVIVAYAQNGEEVRPDQGYPLRLVVPGGEGVRNVKWLRRIKVVDQPYMTRAETVQYPDLLPNREGKALWFEFELPTKSVITFPAAGGRRLPGRGFYEITGLAWSGGGAIRRVEVSTDGGRIWKDAQIQEPVHRMAHTRFRFPWNWDGEEAVLLSRSADERGNVQPTLAEFAGIWGVNVDYLKTVPTIITVPHQFNPIQPWKVTREGSVENAIWL